MSAFEYLAKVKLKTGLCALVLVLFSLGYLFQAVGIYTRLSRVPHQEQPSAPKPRASRDLLKVGPVPERNDSQTDTFVDVLKLRPKVPNLILNHDPLAHIKNSLQDTNMLAKMREMEDKRQDLYVKVLKKRGQMVKSSDGGWHIISYPRNRVIIPNVLKKRDPEQWTANERVWMNISHYPWHQFSECKDFHVSFARHLHERRPIGLVSYPSSGNTWLRYLIEGASGIFTGSMYNDISLKNKGFYGEGMPWNSGLTVAIKSHGHTTEKGAHVSRSEQKAYNHFEELNHTAVLLIRNPFRAIVGHRHLDAGGHIGHANISQFRGEGWDYFVRHKIEHWENLYLDWLSEASEGQLQVVHYELLKEHPVPILRRILNFFQIGVNEDRLQCLIEHSEGAFRRRKQHFDEDAAESASDSEKPGHTGGNGDDDMELFSAEHKYLIRAAMERVSATLRARQLQDLPYHLYDLK